MIEPGLHPEGPSPANMHHFPHWGLYSRTGGGKPKGDKKAPYKDSKADLEQGDFAADLEPEVQDLPETISEFFKFTQPASDNTSFHRPPHYGSGAPRGFGKNSKEFASYDPSSDEEEDETEEKNKERLQTIRGSSFQKVGIFENPQMREREPRDENDYVTKQPWASGIPGRDKKDIIHGDEKIDELFRDKDREENKEKYEGKLETFFREIKESSWADTSFSRMYYGKKMQTPRSDLNFWDIIKKGSKFLLNDPDEEVEDENKEEE